MSQTIDVVYENGVLRLLTPVAWPEKQRLTITVTAVPTEDDVLDLDCIEDARQQGDDAIRLEDVRQALAGIPGSVAADVRAERADRG